MEPVRPERAKQSVQPNRTRKARHLVIARDHVTKNSIDANRDVAVRMKTVEMVV